MSFYDDIIARSNHNRPRVEPYLTKRNIDLETAEHYDVGYMAAFPSMGGGGPCVKPPAQEKRCGLCLPCEATHWNKTLAWQTDRLIIPARGASGRITALVARSLTDKKYTFYDTPWGSVEGPLLGMKQALVGINKTKVIRPVEGAIDILALAQAMKAAYHSWDDVNVVSVMTVYMTDAKIKQMARYADHCQLCLDNDASGKKMMKRLQEDLKPWFKGVEVLPYPTKDWAAWNEHNRKEFEKKIRQMIAV